MTLHYSAKGMPMRDRNSSRFRTASKVGLKVNASETKEMTIGSPSNTEDVTCKDQALERVEAFTYLCSTVTTTVFYDVKACLEITIHFHIDEVENFRLKCEIFSLVRFRNVAADIKYHKEAAVICQP